MHAWQIMTNICIRDRGNSTMKKPCIRTKTDSILHVGVCLASSKNKITDGMTEPSLIHTLVKLCESQSHVWIPPWKKQPIISWMNIEGTYSKWLCHYLVKTALHEKTNVITSILPMICVMRCLEFDAFSKLISAVGLCYWIDQPRLVEKWNADFDPKILINIRDVSHSSCRHQTSAGHQQHQRWPEAATRFLIQSAGWASYRAQVASHTRTRCPAPGTTGSWPQAL